MSYSLKSILVNVVSASIIPAPLKNKEIEDSQRERTELPFSNLCSLSQETLRYEPTNHCYENG